MAKVENAQGLGPSQVLILNVLAKASTGMTAGEISFAGKGIPVNVNTIGPVFSESLENYPDSLRGRGLVRPQQYEGDDVQWFITDKGKQLGLTLKAHKIGATQKIPNDILDPVAIAMKKRRAYPFEEFTPDDLKEMRTMLPKEYAETDLEEMRRQAQARRKQSIFSDPIEKKNKCLKKLLREFGVSGTVIPDLLTEDQISRIYQELGVYSEDE